ncbi:hypothetical protein [Streptomyces sp. NPDC054940]
MADEVLVGLIAAGSATAETAIGAAGAVLAGRIQAQRFATGRSLKGVHSMNSGCAKACETEISLFLRQ